MIIAKSSKYLSNLLLSNINEEERLSETVLSKRISLIFIYISVLFVSIVAGFLLNNSSEIFLSFLIVLYIRMLSGGNHSDSPDACFLLTTFVIIIVPLTHEIFKIDLNYIIEFLVMLVYLFYSPHSFYKLKDYWCRKFAIISGLLYFYFMSKDYFYTVFAILAIDQVLGNKNIKTNRR